ncbi:MAG: nucleoside-triphosphatase [Chitinophagales bacterium]|nr:hypothetical protein [Bacteroidota bacterium]MCB9042785.1 hypothetical protein [Chitinophagales bacterium]
MSKIILLSGDKQIGKTSELMRRFAKQTYVGGILMPEKEDGRYFFSLRTKNTWKAEAAANESDILNIGRFTFSAAAFSRANQTILSDIEKYPVIILDEIGPLELNYQKGLQESLEYCLQHCNKIRFLILVVRPSLLENLRELCEKFSDKVSVVRR